MTGKPLSAYRRRVDRNRADIVETFTRMGCRVVSLERLGEGVPDFLIGDAYGSHGWPVCYLVKLKNGPRAKLTPTETKWRAEWPGPYEIVRDPLEVPPLVLRYRRIDR